MISLVDRIVSDFRLIKRDGILLVGILAPIFIAFLFRVGFSHVAEIAYQLAGLNLYNHLQLIMGVTLLMTPSMLGMMAGFMLLDDRDEGLLTYFAVTPLKRIGYIRYRIMVTFILSLFLFYVVVSLSDLLELSWWVNFPLSILYALEAPIFALLLALFANNKVEGLALNKVLSVSIIVPIIAYFVPEGWEWLFMLVPTFWPVWTLLFAGTFDFWLYLIGGMILHIMIILFLINMFLRKTE
ncbi:hypothetical protein LG307_13870 [Sutcliffiella horikoshii]|uniref:hypothetical protein n=1 Tax=Sutcliffiella horikoshii TaxID=79883 RepID=UPI00384C581B